MIRIKLNIFDVTPLRAIALAAVLSLPFTSLSAQETNWLYYSGSPVDSGPTRQTLFIDPFSLTSFDVFKKQITILTEFTGSYQSAMTWGESEVAKIQFDCLNSQMKYSNITWYEYTQANGRVTQEYSDLPWQPIEFGLLKLFDDVCS
ncbi:MAG: hypothetical protein L7U63_01910 [Rhodobacteraceae bacterium]|nr:hypothetical protein [Paracoccaceae bacterium]